jgi:hypothetical protein
MKRTVTTATTDTMSMTYAQTMLNPINTSTRTYLKDSNTSIKILNMREMRDTG